MQDRDSTISRRKVLAALGMAGAAAIGLGVSSVNGSSVSHSVYGNNGEDPGCGNTDDKDITCLFEDGADIAPFLIVQTGTYIISRKYTIGSDVTTSPDLHLIFDREGYIDTGGYRLIIRSQIISRTNGALFSPNTEPQGINLLVPSAGYPTIQSAVDALPEKLHNRTAILIAAGTYDEHVCIFNKWAARGTPPNVPGEFTNLIIRGAGKYGSAAVTNVRSFLVSCSGGTAFSPTIESLNVTGTVPMTNEGASIEFYGCPNGAVYDVSFVGEGVEKCINSYGSNVVVQGIHYGDQLNDYGCVVKNGGVLFDNSSSVPNVGPPSTGYLKKYAYYIIGGQIYASDPSLLKAGQRLFKGSGATAGVAHSHQEQAIWNARGFGETDATTYTTLFTDSSGWMKTNGGSASQGVYDTGGAYLKTGSQDGSEAALSLRREHALCMRRMNFYKAFSLAMKFNRISAPHTIYICFGEPNTEPAFGFKIVNGKIFGFVFVGTENTTSEIGDAAVTPTAVLEVKHYKSGLTEFYVNRELKASLKASSGLYTTTLFQARVRRDGSGESEITLQELRLFMM